MAAVPSGSAQSNSPEQSEFKPATHVAQLDGELEILSKDFKDHTEVSYSLKTPDGKYVPLRFAHGAPSRHLTGDYVHVEGELSNNTLVLYSGASVKTASKPSSGSGSGSGSTGSTGPLPNTLGIQYTLVILVNFQDDAAQPFTVTDAQAFYSGQVNDFWMENSYGQTSMSATVVGWFTIPDSVSTCNLSQMASDAQAAATSAGVNLANYTRYVYAFPQNTSCGFAGSSYVGGNPSQSWINGNTLDGHTIDHELGHGFGLWHSHLYDCGTSATIGSNCAIDEYGDILDTMGAPRPPSPHYNAFQKERLGWLNFGASPSIQTVTTSGTYMISPFEVESLGPLALKVLKSTDSTTGAKTWYYLEFRQGAGFDSFLTTYAGCESCYTQNETTGVLFHIGTDGDGNTGDLLDMTPATPTYTGWYDPSLTVGQSFQDAAAGVSFTPLSVDSSGATVQITINGAPAPGPMSVSVATNQASYLPGQTVIVNVSALSGAAPAAGTGVSAVVMNPSGWSTTLTGTTGSSGVAQLKYSLSKRAVGGTYQVQAGLNATSPAGASPTTGAVTSFGVQ